MIKVAVIDDYQSAFKEVINIEKFKDKLDLKFSMKSSMMKTKL